MVNNKWLVKAKRKNADNYWLAVLIEDKVIDVELKEVKNENTTDTEQPTNVSNEAETKITDEPNV